MKGKGTRSTTTRRAHRTLGQTLVALPKEVPADDIRNLVQALKVQPPAQAAPRQATAHHMGRKFTPKAPQKAQDAPGAPITITVPPEVKRMFRRPINGQGGFQTLFREVAKRAQSHKGLQLRPEEMQRVVRYSTHYGDGGFQQALRWVVALWVDENAQRLLKVAA